MLNLLNSLKPSRNWLPLMTLLVNACSPMVIKPGPTLSLPQLKSDHYITADGSALPMTFWAPEKIDMIFIAIHGFNDYRKFIREPASFFTTQNIACYAYDQRGFGQTPHRGYWAGIDAYTHDLTAFAHLIKMHYPTKPVYLLGESMGGAIVINTLSQFPDLANGIVDGVILVAPAVWGRETMPWYQSTLLWSLAHSLPWITLTGKGLEKMPSDNIEMLRALSRDPLVIKETRVDAIYGITNMMDLALSNAQQLKLRTLVLYGEKDQIIPREPTLQFVQDLIKQNDALTTFALYQQGYHMLLRDLQATVVWQDIISWAQTPYNPLPSGADQYANTHMRKPAALSLSRN